MSLSTHEQGVQIRYNIVEMFSLSVGTDAVPLPDPTLPANWDRVRRIVIRNKNNPIIWTISPGDPDSEWFYALEDEVAVLAAGFDVLVMKQAPWAAGPADVRVIYEGL